MCGIAGLVNFNTSIDKDLLLSMQKAIKHRGPDGSGSDITKNVGLTMRRLSIIDVAGGDQPLFNEDRTISIVGNGEIYNYLELQKELKSKGHKLRTGSDIETAIHAYEEWGLKAIDKFRGQFALAMHDKKRNLLILIRDRMGEKPIYYTQNKNGLAFSSEMKSLLKLPWLDKTLNFKAVDSYFHYYYVPEPLTLFEQVKKLPAGHYAVIDVEKGNVIVKKYWDARDIKVSFKSDPTKKIKSEFERACELTLRSDVPVGISLSGGVDSGSILSFSAPKYKETMKAFSIGYEGAPDSDEREMARKLAKEFKVKFIELEIKRKDVINYFPSLVWNMDDPIADIAGHSIHAVSKLARKNGVKVLLGGVGGDELFWGYPSSIEATIENINSKKRTFKNIFMKKHFKYNNPNPTSTGFLISKLYSRTFSSKIGKNNALSYLIHKKSESNLEIAKHSLALTRDLWLRSDVIALADRLSMANSIELRSPFLDYKLVELALSSKKVVEGYNLEPKYWFKKAMKGVLPDEVLTRPKRGFTPPVGDWIYGITKKYSKLLKSGFLVKSGILDTLKMKHLSGVIGALPIYSTYQLILLEIWGREFVWGLPINKI